jgi:hypothetical protein
MVSKAHSVTVANIFAAIFVFVSIATAQTTFDIYRFPKGGHRGFGPYASLAADAAGNLYGTTEYGGTGTCSLTANNNIGCGTIFRLAPPSEPGGAWTEAVLYDFTGPDGEFPAGGLLFDKAGNLYGTAQSGGPAGGGIVFELTPPVTGILWTLTTLYAFQNPISGYESTPSGNLIFDKFGNLYGITGADEISQISCIQICGTVFQLSPPLTEGGAWSETMIFQPESPSSLIIDANGNLYGAEGGGSFNCGEYGCGFIYQLIPPATQGGGWTANLLYEFTGGSDGAYPSDLVLDAHGTLYGTTAAAGDLSSCYGDGYTGGCGNVFQLAPPQSQGQSWTLTPLYEFQGGADGEFPSAGVTFDEVGNIYGTTDEGGNPACGTDGMASCGTVFKLSPNSDGGWTEEIPLRFDSGDGAFPVSRLLFLKGLLYGDAWGGGEKCPPAVPMSSCGTVFAVKP